MSRNNLSDSLNARIDAFTAKHHNRPLHYLTRAFLAREDCTLSVEDVMRVFDEIPQRSNTTPLREQTGRVSGVVSDVREYNAGLIDAFTVNREVTHYVLKNPEQFSNTGFSLVENHVTNRGRFKKYLTRELYDAIAAERASASLDILDSLEAYASEEVSIPETLLITDESSQMTRDTVNESDDMQAMNEEFALDASDASETRKFKRRDSKRKSVAEDDSQSVAA